MLIGARNAAWGGKRGLSAKDYVQDGLIAMWDGIENAGWGKHSDNPTMWTDLTGNGYDLVGNADGSVVFNPNCVSFEGGGVEKTLYHLAPGMSQSSHIGVGSIVRTAEGCFRGIETISGSGNTGANMIGIATDPYWDCSVGTIINARIIVDAGGSGGWKARWVGNGGSNNYFVNGDIHCVSISNESRYTEPNVLLEGIIDYKVPLNPSTLCGSSIMIGRVYTDIIMGHYSKCDIFNYRLYDRMLSLEEKKHNCAIDKARFGS
jgi:hypothetical protein